MSYSQIAVFADGLEKPFNDWTDQQVLQGFSWRKDSVSFRTLVEDGMHKIDVVSVTKMPAIASDAIRAIEVPFDCPENRAVEIASISDRVTLTMPSGNYLLRCELLEKAPNEDYKIRFTFAKVAPVSLAKVS